MSRFNCPECGVDEGEFHRPDCSYLKKHMEKFDAGRKIEVIELKTVKVTVVMTKMVTYDLEIPDGKTPHEALTTEIEEMRSDEDIFFELSDLYLTSTEFAGLVVK